MAVQLCHVSGWEELSTKDVGDTFVLIPGQQAAEGNGVYFSEEKPRLTAAEGTYVGGVRKDPAAIVLISAESAEGWWRTKNSIVRKFGRPRTWHTDGKSIKLKVVAKQGIRLTCDWSFVEE